MRQPTSSRVRRDLRSEHPAGAQVEQLCLLTNNSLGVLGDTATIARLGSRFETREPPEGDNDQLGCE